MNLELGQILTIVIQYLPEWPVYSKKEMENIAKNEYKEYKLRKKLAFDPESYTFDEFLEALEYTAESQTIYPLS